MADALAESRSARRRAAELIEQVPTLAAIDRELAALAERRRVLTQIRRVRIEAATVAAAERDNEDVPPAQGKVDPNTADTLTLIRSWLPPRAEIERELKQRGLPTARRRFAQQLRELHDRVDAEEQLRKQERIQGSPA